jgi:hypothetical protein
MLFSAAAVLAAIIIAFAARPNQPVDPDTFTFVRTLAFNLMNRRTLTSSRSSQAGSARTAPRGRKAGHPNFVKDCALIACELSRHSNGEVPRNSRCRKTRAGLWICGQRKGVRTSPQAQQQKKQPASI